MTNDMTTKSLPANLECASTSQCQSNVPEIPANTASITSTVSDGINLSTTAGTHHDDPNPPVSAESPILVIFLIVGLSMLLLILLLVALLTIKYRHKIKFFSKNNNTDTSTNENIFLKSSYRQKNKSEPDSTYQVQTDTLQNREYASLTHYSKIGTNSQNSGPFYHQLEANEPTSNSTPTYFVLERQDQLANQETDERGVPSHEYDKLLRPHSPDGRGRDRIPNTNHSDYQATIVTSHDYDRIDRNVNVGTGHHLHDNEYSATTTKVRNGDKAYDRLDHSNSTGNKEPDVVSNTTYNEVQLSKNDSVNGDSQQINDISCNENPYEKTIIK